MHSAFSSLIQKTKFSSNAAHLTKKHFLCAGPTLAVPIQTWSNSKLDKNKPNQSERLSTEPWIESWKWISQNKSFTLLTRFYTKLSVPKKKDSDNMKSIIFSCVNSIHPMWSMSWLKMKFQRLSGLLEKILISLWTTNWAKDANFHPGSPKCSNMGYLIAGGKLWIRETLLMLVSKTNLKSETTCDLHSMTYLSHSFVIFLVYTHLYILRLSKYWRFIRLCNLIKY